METRVTRSATDWMCERTYADSFAKPPADGTFYRSYAHGWVNETSVLLALARARATGGTARWVIAEHHAVGDRVVTTLEVGLSADGEWRYVGERNDPCGAGSHAVAWGAGDAEVAVTIAWRLANHVVAASTRLLAFRQPQE